MNKKGSPDVLYEYNNNKKEQTRQAVLKAIDKIHKSGVKFTMQAVCDEAGVSRMYFSKHPELKELIDKYRDDDLKLKRSYDSKDVIIASQAETIKKQARTIKAFELNENYKEKYLREVERNKQLEQQIKDLLENNINLDLNC